MATLVATGRIEIPTAATYPSSASATPTPT
jgi:hypothetical protein